MTDVLAFIALALAVPVAYLLGYSNAKKAMEQTRRDDESMRLHEAARAVNLRINREWSEAGPLQ